MDSDSDLVFPFPKDTGFNMFLEAIFFQYKMLLGDFEQAVFHRSYTGYDEDTKTWIMTENYLIAIYFIGTTFFTQITILNMLIAIMGASFNKHSNKLAELGKK